MELMSHSSTFLLPPSIQSPPSLTYALAVLNQSLPKFSPLLWSREQHNYACVRTEVPIGFMMTCLCYCLIRTHQMFEKRTSLTLLMVTWTQSERKSWNFMLIWEPR